MKKHYFIWHQCPERVPYPVIREVDDKTNMPFTLFTEHMQKHRTLAARPHGPYSTRDYNFQPHQWLPITICALKKWLKEHNIVVKGEL